MLNHENIKTKNLIQNTDNNNFQNASYDLRVDKIITIEGKEKTLPLVVASATTYNLIIK